MPAQILVVHDDERSRREKYHAVFQDMRMPPPDGVELARQIRASRANASTVVVMITGEEDRAVMRRAFEAGVELFLFKPVERNKLRHHQSLQLCVGVVVRNSSVEPTRFSQFFFSSITKFDPPNTIHLG